MRLMQPCGPNTPSSAVLGRMHEASPGLFSADTDTLTAHGRAGSCSDSPALRYYNWRSLYTSAPENLLPMSDDV